MISVDTVYQRVLAILNKENRGYMTPQEFNLLANQAQLEVFEQYFYDLSQFNRAGGVTNEYADIVKNIKEKINLFKTNVTLNKSGNKFVLPSNMYRLGTVYYNDLIEVEEIAENELLFMQQSPLAKPSAGQPVYTRTGNNIAVYPLTIISLIKCSLITSPPRISWAYEDVNGSALYNATSSVNFDLHESDETTIVYKVLSYAGLIIKQPEVSQIAEQKDTIKVQKEKS
tara:strand:+ start:1014 stop:1697 length:684 start_codon:yes stop_codon:yes gene_type:complete